MAYAHTNSKGRTYYLHSQDTTLKNGGTQRIYYFGKEAKENAIDAVPEGYIVSESRNGLPVLKKG
jgi:YHS domain-containing protein